MKLKKVSNIIINYLVFFLVKGSAGYILPRFNNAVYIKIEEGDHFGHVDLVFD